MLLSCCLEPSFSPEFSSIPDPFKPRPVVLRRNVKGSDIGSKVEMFERMTHTGSRSFSKEDPMLYQMKHHAENNEAKPRRWYSYFFHFINLVVDVIL